MCSRARRWHRPLLLLLLPAHLHARQQCGAGRRLPYPQCGRGRRRRPLLVMLRPPDPSLRPHHGRSSPARAQQELSGKRTTCRSPWPLAVRLPPY